MLRLSLGGLIVGSNVGAVNASFGIIVQCSLHAEAWRAETRVRIIGKVLAPGAEGADKSHSWECCSSKADTFLPIGADLLGVDGVELVCLLVVELLAELVEVV